jgi:hypothetical protein
MNEAAYRDWLYDHIEVIEAGLTVVDREFHLPNDEGTRGFIDILARDILGNWVIIEVKVNREAERSALNELNKYISLVRKNHGISIQKTRCIVVSADWRELRMPIAQLLAISDFPVEGLHLELSDNFQLLRCEPVTLPDLDSFIQVVFSHLHGLGVFKRLEDRAKCLTTIQQQLEQMGVERYVVVKMQATRDIPHSHLLYVAICESDDKRPKASATDAVMETIFRFANEREYSTCDKFSSLLGDFEVEAVCRGPFFTERAQVFTDHDIGRLITGFEGRNSLVYDCATKPAHRLQWHFHLNQVGRFLAKNPKWKNALLHTLRQIEREFPRCVVFIHIFNPMNTPQGIFYAVNRRDPSSLPTLEVQIQNDGELKKLLIGVIEWDGGKRLPDPQALFDATYGSVNSYLAKAHFKDTASKEEEFLFRLGMKYAIVEIEGNNTYKLSTVAHRDRTQVTALKTMSTFFQREQAYCRKLASFIAEHVIAI